MLTKNPSDSMITPKKRRNISGHACAGSEAFLLLPINIRVSTIDSLSSTFEDRFVVGDKVATRLRWTGIHKGKYLKPKTMT